MKRLTKRVNGVVVYVGAHNDTDTGQIPCEVSAAGVREIMEQLAGYEDSGERQMEILADLAAGTFAEFWKSCEAKEPIMQAEQVEERRGKATVNCLRCRFRHEDNGNCTAVGGFCTAVQAAHCPLLRQYLDTGMTPEAFQSYVVFLQDLIGDQKASEALDRFRQLVKADRDGRLVVSPCKAGDTVYEVTSRKTISEYRVKAIRVELFCTFIEWDIVAGFADKFIFGVPVDEIGKTVFLTREEAEKALEAMKDD